VKSGDATGVNVILHFNWFNYDRIY